MIVMEEFGERLPRSGKREPNAVGGVEAGRAIPAKRDCDGVSLSHASDGRLEPDVVLDAQSNFIQRLHQRLLNLAITALCFR